MSTYTGSTSGALALTVSLPDDGDDIEAADVNVPIEALVDNCAKLDATRVKRAGDYITGDLIFDAAADIELPASANIKIATVGGGEARTRAVGRPVFDPAVWSVNALGRVSETGAPAVGGPAKTMQIEVQGHEIPHGVTITGIAVRVRGGGGHSGGGPAVLPAVTVSVFRFDLDTATSYTPKSDVYGSAAAYEAPHSISLTGAEIPTTWDATGHRMIIGVASEYGTGTFAGFTVIGATVTYKQGKLDT